MSLAHVSPLTFLPAPCYSVTRGLVEREGEGVRGKNKQFLILIMMKKAFAYIALLLACTIGAEAQQVAPFKKGDRVTFVGNSITDGGHYHSYIWLYYMTHFPMERMWMANCGIGGDTGQEILNRLDYDVFSKRPTVLTLTFGMNDSGYFEYNGDQPEKFAAEKYAQAKHNFSLIEQRLKGLTDTRIVMVGTSPYDQTSTFNDNVFKNKNNTIGKIVALQDSVAKANHWEMVDFWAPMNKINADNQAKDPKFTINGSDRIHPDNDGHLVMANSLPYPIDTIARGWEFHRQQKAALKVIPQFMQEMDNEAFCVKGLKGNYSLEIDDVMIDTLSATQLAEGINLATYDYTPQYVQAKAVMELNEMRWEIERQFRDYGWLQYNFFMKHGMLEQNDHKAAQTFLNNDPNDVWVHSKANLYDRMIHREVREAMNKQMDVLVDKIYDINKPVSHRITLTPVKL